jgi:hypothetical protein
LPLFVCQITGVYFGIHTSVIGQKPTFRTLSKAGGHRFESFRAYLTHGFWRHFKNKGRPILI